MAGQELNTVLDFYQIVKEYTELIRLDYPVLFSGKNKYNSMVIGTVVYDDYDNDQYTLIQVPVEVDDYYNFLNKKITLRKIYEKQDNLLMVVTSYEGKTILNNLLPLNEVPKNFLPLEDSFCPDIIVPKTTQFGFALKGKLADAHKALVHDVNEMQEKILEVFQQSVELIMGLTYKPKIYLQPSERSSFKINFDIEFEQDSGNQYMLYPIDKEKIADFFSDYIDYVIRDLPQGQENLIGKTDDAPVFQKIKSKLKSVYQENNVSDTDLEYKLVESIAETAMKVSQVTELFKNNESFDSLVVNKVLENREYEYGYLNQNYYSEISEKILLPEETTTHLISIEKEIDDFEKQYRIRVTHFGETGTGRAELFFDETDNHYKIRLRVNKAPGQTFTNSVYTNSLNEGIPKDVKGIATKVNGKFQLLVCNL